MQSGCILAMGARYGSDTQGEACFNVSYLGSNSVSTSSKVHSVASIRCERGGDTQGEACFNISYSGSNSVSTKVQSGSFHAMGARC